MLCELKKSAAGGSTVWLELLLGGTVWLLLLLAGLCGYHNYEVTVWLALLWGQLILTNLMEQSKQNRYCVISS